MNVNGDVPAFVKSYSTCDAVCNANLLLLIGLAYTVPADNWGDVKAFLILFAIPNAIVALVITDPLGPYLL